ncbi:MAG TPA: hypothetical protein VMU51_21045 [Mycobacteriales bacterium]|nr:hypothetical protein [Mycobacteriales bacterium]
MYSGPVVTGDYFHGVDLEQPGRLRFLWSDDGSVVGVEVAGGDGVWSSNGQDRLFIGDTFYRCPPGAEIFVPAKLRRLIAAGGLTDQELQRPDPRDHDRPAGWAFRPWIAVDSTPDPLLLAHADRAGRPSTLPLPKLGHGYVGPDGTGPSPVQRYAAHIEWMPKPAATTLYHWDGPADLSLDEARAWCAERCDTISIRTYTGRDDEVQTEVHSLI